MECGFSVSKSGVSNDEVRSHFRQIRVKKKPISHFRVGFTAFSKLSLSHNKDMVFVGFFLVFVFRNRVLILSILVISRVWFLHASLELGMFSGTSYFLIAIDKTVNKSPSQRTVPLSPF